MNKFALITGGSKGLGAALIKRFWQNGYSLVVVARDNAPILKIIEDLPSHINQSVHAISCDLADEIEVLNLIEKIKRLLPHLDVLVNNAAIQGPIGPFIENDLDYWRETIKVDLFAPVALCRGLIPLMHTPRGGSIINLSGGGATGPRVNFSAYATAKAALVRFSETLAIELISSGIRVNCIAPGAMKTAMMQEIIVNKKRAGESEVVMAINTLKQSEDSINRVIDLTLFLAGQESAGITGKIISAIWDDWENWPQHLDALTSSDVYTLRRITGRDREMKWGDK